MSGTPPNLTYTAQVAFSGEDSFTFKANDGKYDSPPATITITVNNAPTAPTSLNLTSLDISGTVTNGGYLATLITEDPNDEDTHTYTLVPGTGQLRQQPLLHRRKSTSLRFRLFRTDR